MSNLKKIMLLEEFRTILVELSKTLFTEEKSGITGVESKIVHTYRCNAFTL